MNHGKQTGGVDEKIRLIGDIEQAFEASPLPNPITVCGSDCPECSELTAEFQGRSWRDIDDARLEANRSMSFFTPTAFHYFLLAYLRYSVAHFNLDSEVCEFTVYGLCPSKEFVKEPVRTAWMRERFRCFDRKQAAVVLRFLTLVLQDGELSGFHSNIEKEISDLKGLLRDLKLVD